MSAIEAAFVGDFRRDTSFTADLVHGRAADWPPFRAAGWC